MKELEQRKEIWKNISEFYLDTELQASDYLWISKNLKKSNLSIEELKEIDLYEVFPSLQINLNSVAGEWVGFNEKWLIEECTKNYKKKNKILFRFITRLRNKTSYWMRKRHWDKIENLIQSVEINEEVLMGKYKIRDTFILTNRGIVLAGEIVEGKITTGDLIRFNFKNVIKERRILGIEEIRTIDTKKSNTGLIIECQDDKEIEQLQNWEPNETDSEIFRK